MSKNELSCPAGYKVTNRGWSKAGYMRYCEPYKHGPWEAWSEGYLQVKGEYKHGKKYGAWQWYNRDGSIKKAISYDGNNEVVEQ